mgnify:CR=1 FL=1
MLRFISILLLLGGMAAAAIGGAAVMESYRPRQLKRWPKRPRLLRPWKCPLNGK